MPHNTIVIDTNVLISFVTDRNPTQQQKAADLFQGAASLKKGILCPQNVLTEFVYVLDRVYSHPRENIRSMIADFIALPGVILIHEVDFNKLMGIWPEFLSDFGHAIVAAVCMATKNTVVATFDTKFAAALDKLGLPLASM